MADPSAWLARAAEDARVAWHCRGLDLVLRVEVGEGPDTIRRGLRLFASPAVLAENDGRALTADIVIAGPPSVVDQIAQPAPPPGLQSFGAWLRHDTGLNITGDPLIIAQALAALERLVELARPAAGPGAAITFANDPARVHGHQRLLTGPGGTALIHWLHSGAEGDTPLLYLHTAGADARQYRHQLADLGLIDRGASYAFDMPWHGYSGGVDGVEATHAYTLTEPDYLGWCTAFIERVIARPVIVVGCSMGAAMALTLTARRPDLIAGCLALEAPLSAPGRYNDLLTDARVADSQHNPSYVRALLSPTAPQRYRDEAAAIYAQGRPGVYMGDLAYYSNEYDGSRLAEPLRQAGRPIELLTGAYDYSASPDNTRRLEASINAPDLVTFTEMPALGHFPMIEDPQAFRPYLLAALDRLDRKDR